ncbi:MAG: sulfatase-like hydrolase/transferase [Bacteroidia bacterium]|nr:sulfatase-like hydrolase/transferase [Bacteroidia bacterium]
MRKLLGRLSLRLKIGIVLLMLLLGWLLWPLSSAEFEIRFDEARMAFNRDFLAQTPEKPATRLPNIVLIMADDLGKTDISLYGSPFLQTPHLDSIGLQGVTFGDGYVSSPVCSPSRAGLLTGRYQQRYGYDYQYHLRYPKNRLEYFVFDWFIDTDQWDVATQSAFPRQVDMDRQGLPPSEITLAELLKKQGYATGIIGKWHLGNQEAFWPTNRGFDYHYGFLEAHSMYYPDTSDPFIVNQRHKDFSDPFIWGRGREESCAIRRNNELVLDSMYLTDRIREEAVNFIQSHKENPFFLYLPFSAPHTPFQATRAYYDQFAHIKDRNKRVYLAMIKSLDDAVGEIMHSLRENGLDENTLVVFLSDNGGATYTGATDNAPLKGGKFTHFEGGLNVPLMMRWPGVLPSGKKYDSPVIAMDIFATIASLAQVALPTDRPYDGQDLLPYLQDSVAGAPHEVLCWRSGYSKAVHKGDWKLVWDDLGGNEALYNILEDKTESQEQVSAHPELVKELKAEFDAWNAQMAPPRWPRVMDYKFMDGERPFYFPL